MNTKRIVFATLMALVPFVANAEQTTTYTNTPSTVGANGTIKIANADAPFATNEPTPADQTHIATTAYVKGAYNDAIAAVNKVAGDVATLTSEIDDKQDKLESDYTSDEMNTTVAGADTMADIIANSLSGTNGSGYLSNEAHANLYNATLASVGGVYAALSQTLSMEGVEIYTTWDDDSATTGLLLKDVHGILPE